MAKILFIVPLLAVLVLVVSGESDFSEFEERLLQKLRGRVNDKHPFEAEYGPNEKSRLEKKQYDGIGEPNEKSRLEKKQYDGIGELNEKSHLEERQYDGIHRIDTSKPNEKSRLEKKQYDGIGEPNEKSHLEKKQYDGIGEPIENSRLEEARYLKIREEKELEELERRHIRVCERVSPVGGIGGKCFNDEAAFLTSGEEHITGFQVRAGGMVDCLGFIYGDKDGYCHGGQGGTLYQQTLGATERITGFSGYAGNVIDQITIHTNVRTYGPYGQQGSRSYNVNFPDREVAYISGTAGGLLDSFLVYYRC